MVSKDPISIGRDDGPDGALAHPTVERLAVSDPTVSRAQAVISRDAWGGVLKDCGSSNGTLVNGTRVSGPVRLAAGDTIQVGAKTTLRVLQVQGQHGSVLALAPEQRQVVVARADEVHAATLESFDWLTFGGAFLASVGGAGTFTGALGKWVAKRASERAQPGSRAGVLEVPKTVIARDLELPLGLPELDHAYARHPKLPERYLPVASFHRYLFEEKQLELVTLLLALGAREIRVGRHEGYDARAGLTLGAAKVAKGELKAGLHAATDRELRFAGRYEPRSAPHVPDGLLWYSGEPLWRALARQRLDQGLVRAQVTLRYSDSFGVDLGLKGTLTKHFGVKLGAEFEEMKASVLELEVDFT
jgi:hypothetical protein